MKVVVQILIVAIILGFLILRDPSGGVAHFVYDSGRALKATATAFFDGVKNGNPS